MLMMITGPFLRRIINGFFTTAGFVIGHNRVVVVVKQNSRTDTEEVQQEEE